MRPASCAATLNERLEPLPGDAVVADAVLCATHAVCIDAPPHQVWPWLAQMGTGRAGWYSHDWIAGAAPSADVLLPGVRELVPGDVLPGTPDGTAGFVVASVDPPRELVLEWPGREGGGPIASWSFVLRAAPDRLRTRLLVRARLSRAALRERTPAGAVRTIAERIYRATPYLPAPVLRAMASLGHDFMQTRQLRGIKRRAEGRAAD
ncbi:MAG TPA: hypothetical protein VF841_06510 [Anaeromyxobacter sp.]